MISYVFTSACFKLLYIAFRAGKWVIVAERSSAWAAVIAWCSWEVDYMISSLVLASSCWLLGTELGLYDFFAWSCCTLLGTELGSGLSDFLAQRRNVFTSACFKLLTHCLVQSWEVDYMISWQREGMYLLVLASSCCTLLGTELGSGLCRMNLINNMPNLWIEQFWVVLFNLVS